MLQSLLIFLESATGAPGWKVALAIAVLVLASVRIGYLIVAYMRKNRKLRARFGDAAHLQATARWHAKMHETDNRNW